MNLTQRDKESELWEKLQAHLGDLLEKARRDNEKTHSHEVTCALRGRIKLLRELMKIDVPPNDGQS